ncbi:MAG: hypothetical protein HKP30_04535 [Myxococcales bacterium]|nr:hypothetical protein [Myxococcales bacterium]
MQTRGAGGLGPGLLPLLLAALLTAPAGAADPVVRRAPPPSPDERYCAWFGATDPSHRTLYFGEAAFWTAFRSQGRDPRADLRATGPQRIGRFDLASERLLPPLEVTWPGSRSGVWDVLPHPNGRVYFTTFFEASGWVDPATGAHARFDEIGEGLSELALASGGQIVAARYAQPGQRDGSLVRFSPDGFLMSEWRLSGPADVRVAPKSVAYDPVRHETWGLTDLLPEHGDGAIGHDARVYDRFGRERLRLTRPEIQFVTFGPDGTGYLAEVEGPSLHLRILAPGDAKAPLERGRRVLLDAGFPAGFDFVQDLTIAPDGRVVATRWSGFVHVVDAAGEATTLRLPRLDAEGLYYTGVVREDRVCATYCSDSTVVCRDAEAP